MKFTKFDSRESNGGIQYRKDFANGYGVSIIRNAFSYGGNKGLWELAVLKDGHLCYDTPITDDVLGYLNESEVDEIVAKVEALPNEAKQFVDNMSDKAKAALTNLVKSMKVKPD